MDFQHALNGPETLQQPVGLQALERHYTVAQLSKLWFFSESTIRRLFIKEPGVIKIAHQPTRVRRGYTEIVECGGRHAANLKLLRQFGAGERHCVHVLRNGTIEHRRLGKLDELWAIESQIVGVGIFVVKMKMHHPHGTAVWVRIDKHCVHNAIDGRLGANPQSQRNYADKSKAWTLTELTKRKSNVLPKAFEWRPTPCLVSLLSNQSRIAESAPSCVSGILW